ncbi:acyl-CoA-binding domain-containing protein 4 isoform X3 [Numida meleagris]|uniref:acyl-CoA-binding domain-containing protein 4 isoform X3 n=1 Tax=Numida meleagris TaxID=8996 RepID=UPI000B3E3AB4|nr:acyl-CoA-binding domain-containing protein 4 isoform X3 [Numida meleagris]
MAEPGCGDQFQAAVRVIQGLPRSGSYRPSYEEMLRFYSYYKQATAGRCQGPRPGFWDPIGRYKWDAWHSLGRMSKEEAMAAYVAEMKKVAQKIIDTVPLDETTQEMFRYFEPLYEVIRDMPRPPEAFFRGTGDEQEQPAEHSQEERAGGPAPERLEDALPGEQQDGQQAPGAGLAPAADTCQGSQGTSDSEGEVFCDTMEQMEPEQAGQLLAERGLSPKSVPAGRVAGRAERGEGRRREGSGGANLAALGSDGAPCFPSRTDPHYCPSVCLRAVLNALHPSAPVPRGPASSVCSVPLDTGVPDPQVARAEQDAGTPPEPTAVDQWLLPELDAHVAGTVRALQDDMQRVLERLSELELLTSVQGRGRPRICPRSWLHRRTGTRWPDGVPSPGCAPEPLPSCRTHLRPIPESRLLCRQRPRGPYPRPRTPSSSSWPGPSSPSGCCAACGGGRGDTSPSRPPSAPRSRHRSLFCCSRTARAAPLPAEGGTAAGPRPLRAAEERSRAGAAGRPAGAEMAAGSGRCRAGARPCPPGLKLPFQCGSGCVCAARGGAPAGTPRHGTVPLSPGRAAPAGAERGRGAAAAPPVQSRAQRQPRPPRFGSVRFPCT